MIDLWAAFHEDILDADLEARYLTLLDETERAQQPRFHFARDRTRYLVTRALARVTLSRYVAIPPAQWRFRAGFHGRPEVANEEPGCARLAFNLSHTRGLVVLAVTRDRAVGVDTEHLHARSLSFETAERFFAAEEVATIRALHSGARERRCFEHWVFKEAYLKARGLGMHAPLEAVRIAFEQEGQVSMSLSAELDDDAARWDLWQLQLSPDHVVALCARSSNSPTPLRVHRTVPLVEETRIAPRIIRRSHRPDSRTADGAS